MRLLPFSLFPRPLIPRQAAPPPDTQWDGAWVPAAVPACRPSEGETLFVNGIRTPLAKQQRDMQQIADATGRSVVGVHNATDGGLLDMGQVKLDKLRRLASNVLDAFEDRGLPVRNRLPSRPPANPAAVTLAAGIQERLLRGEPVQVIGHSQGALVVAVALAEVKRQLQENHGMTRAEAEDALAAVKVESFGGAALTWPDGPAYVHYVNELDPAPLLLGIAGPLSHPGRGAQVVRFRDPGFGEPLEELPPHTVGTYLRHHR